MSARAYRLVNAWVAFGLLIVLAAPRAFTVSPDGGRLLLPGGRPVPELCLTKRTTGRECSSCHLGRSVVLASHGEFGRSLEHHGGGVILFGWTALQLLARIALVFAIGPAARLWWVDLTATLASLAVAAAIVAML